MQELIRKLSSGSPLSEDETFSLFELILSENQAAISNEQIRAYLLSTSSRNLTSDELVGAARSMRKHVRNVIFAERTAKLNLLDTCGTGGSGLNTFSTSTASAFVVAGAGQPVAKHGNRAASSKAGSADVLEALGVKLDLEPAQIATCIQKTGFGFMFAPLHHPATKRVAVIRRELAVRTIFNFLGPLVNPAGACFQVLGVSRSEMVEIMARALARLGTEHALVVHGRDGLDEITLTNSTFAAEVKNGEVNTFELTPEELGLARVSASDIVGAEAQLMAERLRAVLNGEKSAYRDLVSINAAAALYVSGKSETLKKAGVLAARSIDSGKALGVLEQVISFSRSVNNDKS